MVIGRYAIDWHLRPAAGSTLSQIVGDWQQHWPKIVPLPHPSPRNTMWLRRNPAVEAELVPKLRLRIATLLSSACQT
jgi:uracil-DNA glycosylase